MDVDSPVLPATTLQWQPRAGQWALTVLCKGTFFLAPGESRLATEQDPITEGDQHWDDDPTRSLFCATDLVPIKQRTDILLVGHAFAAGGQRVRSLVARMAVDKVDKSIGILADRTAGTDGSVYEGRGFTRMPLVYERAAGGPSTWNPVGVRPDVRDSYGNAALPNLVVPGLPPGEFGEPIGFGPIAPSWSMRSDLWVFEGWGGNWLQEALPEAFDTSFFNVAPRDQQVETLREDVMIHLENLHPEHAVLTTRLPGLRPRVTLESSGHGPRPIGMRADTLFLDADRGTGTIVWRGHVSVERPQESGRVVVELDQRSQTSTWNPTDASSGDPPEINRMATRELSRQPARTGMPTVGLDEKNAAGPLPFGPKTERPAAAAPTTPRPAGGALPFMAKDGPAARSSPRTLATDLPAGLLAAVTPFTPAASPSAPPAPIAPAPIPPPAHAPVTPVVPGPAHRPPPVPLASLGAHASGVPQVRPPLIQHASTAALAGVAGASNAAADPTSRGRAAQAAPAFQGDALQLLWFEPEAAPRMRRRAEWKKILDELENRPPDPDVDQPGLADEPAELEDRREVFEVLAHGIPSGEDGVQNALMTAVRSDGRFAPQLLLLSGEVRFDFDEVETLKAHVSAATPLAGDDDDLKAAIEQGTKYLATPDLMASPDIAEGMTKRIREAFAKAPRVVGPSYLEEQTERALMERRAYQRRDVFGQKHLRALFFHHGSTTGVPTYLAEGLAKKLPLFRRLRVKLLVEAHFQADQYETHSAALRAAAVARMVRSG